MLKFIFAEKLETVVFRGSFNSRMKDFHDLYSMMNSAAFSSFRDLETIVGLVFEHRDTHLALPLLSPEILLILFPKSTNGPNLTVRPVNRSALPS